MKRGFSNPRRYSYLLGEGCKQHTPEEALKGKVGAIEDISSRFAIDVVTKQFYKEIFDWYQWALSGEAAAAYPNGSNEEHLIHLITRLMFVWFIKQKGLIPEDIFDSKELSYTLRDFDPLSEKSGNYYNAILQNLFFATLNRPITDREFASGADTTFHGKNEHYGIKTLYRDDSKETWFKKPNKEIIELFKQVPFLNGGLFECLDKENEKNEKILYFDGFSRDRSKRKRAFVPNRLFFDDTKGIISILKRYNFTVEENTPLDVDVALDPELLGKVFENLLGAYNPETKETARKQSGSFYTPREIVSYMVDESLIAYLTQKVDKRYEGKIRELFAENTMNDESVALPDTIKSDICAALWKCKILDPACGSGAFPMGILNRMFSRCGGQGHYCARRVNRPVEAVGNIYKPATLCYTTPIMPRYKSLTPASQGLFLTVNLNDQILPGSFEFTLDHLIDHSDLSAFDALFHNDLKGAPAYPPNVLLKIILYSYSKGIITSRPIEYACKSNMVIKALARDAEPDHATIAHFISSNSAPMKTLFSQILLQCGELGLITGDLFAIDGCKLPSNASKEWSGTIEELQKKKQDLQELSGRIVDQHIALDKKESLNPTCRSYVYDEGYKKRHIKRIEDKIAYLDQFLADAEPRVGTGGEEIKSNITDEESAKIKGAHGYIQGYNGLAIADSAHQVIVSAEAFGSGSESEHFPAMLLSLEEAMKEVTWKTEPLSTALLEGDAGYFSEQNLKEALARKIEVLIPDQQFRKRDARFEGRKEHGGKGRFTVKDFTYNEKEQTYTCPEGKELEYKGEVKLNRNSGDKYQAKSADCRECGKKEQCIASRGGAAKHARRTLFIADHGGGENICEEMRKKIDDGVYRTLYGRRMQIIEPCFSDITYNKKMNRFSLRSRIKVNIQWLLYCMVHNIGKCVGMLGALQGV